MEEINPQTQIGQEAEAQGLQLTDIMGLVDQVEDLPPEVLDLVLFRRTQAEKENKKGANAQKEETNNLVNAAKQLGIQSPVAAPQAESDSGSLGQILSGLLGGVDPERGI